MTMTTRLRQDDHKIQMTTNWLGTTRLTKMTTKITNDYKPTKTQMTMTTRLTSWLQKWRWLQKIQMTTKLQMTMTTRLTSWLQIGYDGLQTKNDYKLTYDATNGLQITITTNWQVDLDW
jgi:hypothetical protein